MFGFKDMIINDYPKGMTFVIISNGIAYLASDLSSFAPVGTTLGFDTKNHAVYFVNAYDSKMHDYKEACEAGDYTFYVLLETPNGLYANSLRMTSNYIPIDLR